MLASSGCSLRTMAVNAVVPVLADPAVYLSEEDPGAGAGIAAVPAQDPRVDHPDRARSRTRRSSPPARGSPSTATRSCRSTPTIASWDGEYDRELELRDRTWRLYVRARDYCLSSLGLKYAGLGDDLRDDPASALDGHRRRGRRGPVLPERGLGAGHLERPRPARSRRRSAGGAGAPRAGPRARRGLRAGLDSRRPHHRSSRCRRSSAARRSGPASTSNGRSSCRTGSTPRRT